MGFSESSANVSSQSCCGSAAGRKGWWEIKEAFLKLANIS